MQLQTGEPLYQIMLARYYGDSVPRFLSVDPIGGSPNRPQSWNRYAYVLGNPMKLVDPTGMYWAPGTPMPILPGDPNGCTMCKDSRTDEEKKITEDPKVKSAARKAWRMSRVEERPIKRLEAGFVVLDDGSGSYSTTEVAVGKTPMHVFLADPGDDGTIDGKDPVLDVHTHPSAGQYVYDDQGNLHRAGYKPSGEDVTNARRRGLPGIVIERGAMWSYNGSGEIREILTRGDLRAYMGW